MLLFTTSMIRVGERFKNQNPVCLDGKLLCRGPESDRYGPRERGFLSSTIDNETKCQKTIRMTLPYDNKLIFSSENQ